MRAISFVAVLLCAFGVSPALAANEISPFLRAWNVACPLNRLSAEARSLREIPEPVLAALRAKFLSGDRRAQDMMARFPQLDFHPGEISDIGGPFNPSHAGRGIKRRFVRGGRMGDVWFVWYEQGGVGVMLNLALLRINARGTAATAVGRLSLSPGPCEQTEAVLDGRLAVEDRSW